MVICMIYDPRTDLLRLEAEGIIESFTTLGSTTPTYGIILDEGDLKDVRDGLRDGVRIEAENDEHDAIVVGSVGIVRT